MGGQELSAPRPLPHPKVGPFDGRGRNHSAREQGAARWTQSSKTLASTIHSHQPTTHGTPVSACPALSWRPATASRPPAARALQLQNLEKTQARAHVFQDHLRLYSFYKTKSDLAVPQCALCSCHALTNLSLLWIFGVSVQETKGIIPTPIFSEGAGREY